MSQNQQKYYYEFMMKSRYYKLIKDEYHEAERVLSDIVSILKSSFDKKYILKNEDKYIQKVIAMLIDIRKIESDIKGIYFGAENDKLEEPYKGLQEIKENVNALKWYYDRVNLLIKSYNKLYPGTIKAADKDEDIANKCDDIKRTLKKIAVEISKMIQKSKNEINKINKASDPETHTQKTKDTLDLLQKKIDKLEKDQVEVHGHIDNMKEARYVLTEQMKITDILNC